MAKSLKGTERATEVKKFGTGKSCASKNAGVAGMGPAAANEDKTMNQEIKIGDVFPQKTIEYVNGTVHRTAARYGFDAHEEDDFRQNIFLALLKKMKNFDPTKGCSLETYLHMVVDGYAKDYVTKLRCPQKIVRTVLVLDAPVGEGDVGEGERSTMLDFVADERPNGQDLADQRADVKNVLARLDDQSRKICLMIMAGKELKEIYPALGISKTRFYARVFPDLQKVFKQLLES